jgi:hypothetical protein
MIESKEDSHRHQQSNSFQDISCNYPKNGETPQAYKEGFNFYAQNKIEEAHEFFKTASASGFPPAFLYYHLTSAFLHVELPEELKFNRTHLKWITEKALNGDVDCQFHMAIFHEYSQSNLHTAAIWYERAAMNGHTIAQLRLGGHYVAGTGVVKNLHRAIFFFRKAALQGNHKAQAAIGTMYQSSEFELNNYKAFQFFQLAAVQGNSFAQSKLAEMYELAKGTNKDIPRAIHWYEKSDQKNSAEIIQKLTQSFSSDLKPSIQSTLKVESKSEAMDAVSDINKGKILFDKAITLSRINSPDSLDYFEQAAKFEYPPAYLFLANMYSQGIGPTRADIAKQQHWQSKAQAQEHWYLSHAETGNAEYQYYCGMYYFFAAGSNRNLSKARSYYGLAAEQDYPAAQYWLGAHYVNQPGNLGDLTLGMGWLHLAAAKDFALAQDRLGKMYFEGTGVEKNLHEAFRYYSMAAQQDLNTAWNNMGIIYLTSDTVLSKNKSFECFSKAAELGLAEAQYNLAEAYEIGRGTSQDFEKAQHWYKKSLEYGYSSAQEKLDALTSKTTSPKTEIKANTLHLEKLNLPLAITVPLKNENGTAEDALIRNGVAYLKKREIQQARNCFLKAEKLGFRPATIFLAKTYDKTTESAQHKKYLSLALASRAFFSQEAQQGNPEYQYYLAELLLLLDSTNFAIQWFRRAAKGGQLESQIILNPKGKDERLFLKAAQNDPATIQYLTERSGRLPVPLNTLFLNMQKAEQKTASHQTSAQSSLDNSAASSVSTEGVAETKDSSSKKLSNQLFNSAYYLYERGDFQNAFTAFEDAEKNKVYLAPLFLGIMFQRGQGVAQDLNQARAWYSIAKTYKDLLLTQAATGNRSFHYFLALYYFFVDKDYLNAINYFLAAAIQGHPGAQKYLGYFYLNGCAIQQDETLGACWTRLAAFNGNPIAQYNLAICYEKGIGTPQNLTKSGQLFYMAAREGNIYAYEELEQRYGKRNSIQDFAAVSWFGTTNASNNQESLSSSATTTMQNN